MVEAWPKLERAETVRVEAPVKLMLPNPEAMEPEERAPTEVSEEETMPEPKEVESRTLTLLMR